MERKTRVLVVEDSAAVRRALTEIIASDPGLEVMATAADPYFAVERIREEVPDVIFLDIEMPRMDGLTFLRRLMAQRPIPVVVCSTLTQDGSEAFMAALEAGAIEVVPKPRVDTARNLHESRIRICNAVRAAAQARMAGRPRPHRAVAATPFKVEAKLNADAILPPLSESRRRTLAERLPATAPVVAIGASTGGTEALREVLEALPVDSPAIVIVQHMPEHFTEAFARRLDRSCAIGVAEARDGDEVRASRALIAPGDRHMLLARTGGQYAARIVEGPHVARHRPSVDVLFRSVAQVAASNALGILLTGMGDDGANGLLEIRQTGGLTVAQDEASSIVFGMPKEAIERGAAMRVLPLDKVAGEIMAFGRRFAAGSRT